MKLLIFGATGGTGQELVRQALELNHDVTAFVRTPAKLAMTKERLRVVKGDIADPPTIRAAIPGHDAVLSALGTRRSARPRFSPTLCGKSSPA